MPKNFKQKLDAGLHENLGENASLADAIAYLDNVDTASDLEDAVIHSKKYQLYIRAKETARAYDAISSAIALVREPAYYFYRAVAGIRLKQYESALDDCTCIIAISNDNENNYYVESAHLVRAQAHYLLGEYHQALQDLAYVAKDATLWTDRLISREMIESDCSNSRD